MALFCTQVPDDLRAVPLQRALTSGWVLEQGPAGKQLLGTQRAPLPRVSSARHCGVSPACSGPQAANPRCWDLGRRQAPSMPPKAVFAGGGHAGSPGASSIAHSETVSPVPSCVLAGQSLASPLGHVANTIPCLSNPWGRLACREPGRITPGLPCPARSWRESGWGCATPISQRCFPALSPSRP